MTPLRTCLFRSLSFEIHHFLECELPIPQSSDTDNKALSSPKLSLSINKSKQQLDVAKQARSVIPTHNGTQTGLEVRCEETQTDRMPGPGFILAEHQDYLRRYSMDEVIFSKINLGKFDQIILVSKIDSK
jgi:hypothetical protein